MFTVKPKDESKRVRDPKTQALLSMSGIKIEEMDSYWFRREEDGDVVIEEVKAVKGEK